MITGFTLDGCPMAPVPPTSAAEPEPLTLALVGDIDFEGDSGTDVAVAGDADADAAHAPVFLEAKDLCVARLAAVRPASRPRLGIPLPMAGAEAQEAAAVRGAALAPNPYDGQGGPCTDLAPAPMGDPRQARFWAVLR